MVMEMVLENERVFSRFNEVSMFTSGDSYTEYLITLCLSMCSERARSTELYIRELIAAAGTGNRRHAGGNNH